MRISDWSSDVCSSDLFAYLIPVIILSTQLTGVPIPQLMYGQALQEIAQLEGSNPALAAARPHMSTFADFTEGLNFFALLACLMIGTASLPHVLVRFFTTPHVREDGKRTRLNSSTQCATRKPSFA